MQTINFAEYIWIDGTQPTQQLRAKTRVLKSSGEMGLSDFPLWSFDGSSTGQSNGEDSDLFLVPVRCAHDPYRGRNSYLLLCEVTNSDGSAHASNQRALLRQTLDRVAREAEPWIGFEQEYTIFRDNRPLGFPIGGYPAPQGPYYCGVGIDRAFGRDLAEGHARACVDAGLMLYGINAEVMPGQWEFQIGHRGDDGETPDILKITDQLWLARYLLHREAERLGYRVSFDNKPVSGDWNGAGMHTNFSTVAMRDPYSGRAAIESAIEALSQCHDLHIPHYGADLASRLTGLHETCSIDSFKSGVAHRGAAIRIPRSVEIKGRGYFEDRRPGANADPYRVAARLIATLCASSDEPNRTDAVLEPAGV